jgi:hypothetical protein
MGTTAIPLADDGPRARAFLKSRQGINLKVEERKELQRLRYEDAMERQKAGAES